MDRFIFEVSIDLASIVPSVRDFLQAIATRRKCLALVPLVERSDDARALAEAGVAAFAVLAPSDGMRAVSASVGPAPVLSLTPIASEMDALNARAAGADAVIIPIDAEASSWESMANHARSTRMAGLAMVSDRASAELCRKTAAKAVYLRIGAISELPSVMPTLGSLRVLVHLPSADEATLRGLRGVVDGAIVESDLYLSTSFESLREELDP